MKRSKYLGILVFIVSLTSYGAAPVSIQPANYHPEVAKLVSLYLSYYHYQKQPINDETSKVLLKEYLESLDPNRMFFLKSDIDAFNKYATVLDDHLLADPTDLSVPFFIFNRFKQRVHERVDQIEVLLKQDVDFAKNEAFQYDRTEAAWPKNGAEAKNLWRLRLKEEMVRFELREKPKDEYLDLLEKRYARLRKNIDENEAPDIMERYLASLATTFDPHSSYLKPATKDNFDIQMGHSLEGIGATLTRDGEYTRVVDIVKGGPADLGGELRINDRIIAVGQGDKKPEDVVDLRLDKVVKQIRGRKGSKVRLVVIPANAADPSKTQEIEIIRDRVEITAADAKAEVKEVKDDDGRIYRLGVINIPSFYMDSSAKFKGEKNYKSTTRDVRKLITDLETKDIDGLVVDLRTNGGGSLDEAIELTGLFIKNGPVVQIKDHQGRIRVEKDPDPKVVYDGPLLVLTSVFSASASEIFASAIQDYNRGIVVGGEATHGKGTVQNIIGLQNSLSRRSRRAYQEDVAGALKVTTHKFYRVSGGSTQARGVVPDIVLPSPFDGMDVTEADLDYALPYDEIRSVSFTDYKRVREALPFLRTASEKRVSKDPEFGYVMEDVAERERREAEKTITLNLEQRRDEMKALEAKAEKRKQERLLRATDVIDEAEEIAKKDDEDTTESETDEEEVKVPDYVLEESLMILRDYLAFKLHRVAADVAPAKKESL